MECWTSLKVILIGLKSRDQIPMFCRTSELNAQHVRPYLKNTIHRNIVYKIISLQTLKSANFTELSSMEMVANKFLI
jgi:hypothetical protein